MTETTRGVTVTIYEELKELNVEIADGMKRYNLLGNLEGVGTAEQNS